MLVNEMPFARVLESARIFGDTGVLSLNTDDVELLHAFVQNINIKRGNGFIYTIIPRELVDVRSNVNTLLKPRMKEFDLQQLPRALFFRNAGLTGKLVVVKSRTFGAADKTIRGESKEDWRSVEMVGDEDFMESLKTFPESHWFRLGAGAIQLWGGIRKEEKSVKIDLNDRLKAARGPPPFLGRGSRDRAGGGSDSRSNNNNNNQNHGGATRKSGGAPAAAGSAQQRATDGTGVRSNTSAPFGGGGGQSGRQHQDDNGTGRRAWNKMSEEEEAARATQHILGGDRGEWPAPSSAEKLKKLLMKKDDRSVGSGAGLDIQDIPVVGVERPAEQTVKKRDSASDKKGAKIESKKKTTDDYSFDGTGNVGEKSAAAGADPLDGDGGRAAPLP